MRTLLLVALFAASLTAQSAKVVRKRAAAYLAPLAEQGLFSGTVLLAR